MSLVYSRSPSGLVVAEQSSDEASVADALRQHDPDLRLIRGFDEDRHVWTWRVYRYAGADRDALFVCFWGDENGPFPLSHRLLDKVKELDRNTRGTYLDEDQRDQLRAERLRKESAEAADTIIREHLAFSKKRFPVARSVKLRQTRDRVRRQGGTA